MNFVWSGSDILRQPFDSSHPCQLSYHLLDLILQIRSRLLSSIPLQPLAIEALNALDARADEDIQVWAEELAADIFDTVD
ncbi:MAG: hypothetical protein SWY16_21260 [Cyanobacteriota bacterium]|nr:hypothetical protein [Cyanobacteriota bacterium]